MLITQRGRGGDYDGSVCPPHTSFYRVERNEHGDFLQEKITRTNREHVLSRRKRKRNCGDDTDAEGPKTTTAGLLNQLNWIALSNVACTSLRIRGLR